MAKRKLADLVPEEAPKPERRSESEGMGRTISVGVGLKEGEVEALDRLAENLDVSRNALMGWALRWFMKQHKAGKVEIPVEQETKTRLRSP